MNTTNTLERRKDPFLKSGKRTNFERRDLERELINGNIIVDYKTPAVLVNVDYKGCCIECEQPLEDRNILVDLMPYLNFQFDTKMIWKQEDPENKKFLYGFQFIFMSFQKITAQQDMKTTLMLNRQLFIDHANVINSHIKNLKLKNLVTEFFIEDVFSVVKNLIDLEEKVKNHTTIDKDIYLRLREILDNFLVKAENLVRTIDNHPLEQKIKQRVRAILGYFLYQSVVMKRNLEKPRGYAGDYVMLEQVYDNVLISNHLGKYIDRYHLDDKYAQAVRGRKDLTREFIKNILLKNTGKELKILNLASGSVRELRELFKDFKSPTKATFMCLDQDIESINFCKEELAKIDTGLVKIDFFQENILQLEKLNIPDNSVDILYSIGIADYLQDRMLDKIFKDSFKMLKTNGQILFAYKDKDKHKPLNPNWNCDWNFIPRNEEEFINLIKKSLEGNKYNLEIVRETETGIIFFVVITKL